jgi:hypothetical protein
VLNPIFICCGGGLLNLPFYRDKAHRLSKICETLFDIKKAVKPSVKKAKPP